jgi:SAM-dependent methyltransferase
LFATLERPIRLLDVGGTESYWRNAAGAELEGLDITLLNLRGEVADRPGLHGMLGDARDLSHFANGQFDVVFSNSVIEHVGELDDQRRMAAEVARVGRYYYVQTPNRRFPIEPHLVFPFFQYLPVAARVALVRRFQLGWAPKMPDRTVAERYVRSIRLLTRRELQSLFPDATVRAERFLGFAKSWIAYRAPGTEAPAG